MLPALSVKFRNEVTRGRGILGLILLAIAYGHFQAPARAATGPADGAMIETTINSPRVNSLSNAPAIDKTTTPAQTGNPLWAIPLRALSITRERPLFSPSRRPPPAAVVATPVLPPPQAPAQQAEPDHPLLTLVGTIVGETQRIGVFVDQVAKTVIRLKTGQGHDGWTLRAVEGREAIFKKDEREATLALPARSEASPAGASIPALIPVAASVGNTWRDGDGQLIAPPQSLWKGTDGKSAAAPAPNWTDGDGQRIAPPPARVGSSEH